MSKTAILIDGGFLQKRMNAILGETTPEKRAYDLIKYCTRHLSEQYGSDNQRRHHDLYRIFYYDCPPLGGNVFHPLLDKNINLQKSQQYQWMTEFIKCLYNKRKVAVRLGRLAQNSQITLKHDAVKKLMNETITIQDLTEADFVHDIKQKGVDMRIGIDIASLAFKQQVDQIILIAGDSDFVPAAKLARREGIDFVLDPLRQQISPDLFEHIDGMRSCFSSQEIKDKKLMSKRSQKPVSFE